MSLRRRLLAAYASFLLNDTTSRCSSIQNLDTVGLASGLLISHMFFLPFFLFSLLGHDGVDEKTRMNDINDGTRACFYCATLEKVLTRKDETPFLFLIKNVLFFYLFFKNFFYLFFSFFFAYTHAWRKPPCAWNGGKTKIVQE
ncbi:hypothetical protein B0T13DRAFT_460344 [Neurospora crassa]|nr:hypothetical protein B0T13DRAFT_460344 [Neurospora crassa]